MAVDIDKFGPSGPFGPTFQLIPGVQSYDWGKLADEGSLVADFAEATVELGFEKQGDQPYAELWMGTHPSLPSTIIPPLSAPRPPAADNGSQKYISLSSYLERHPSLVGKQVQHHFSAANASESNGGGGEKTESRPADLPFLFKVLSIGKALSIQAHPDKTLAKRLHEEKPKMYKDGNHKPEMAIALSNFKGFCGFRPLEEIADFLVKVPEFQSLVKPSSVFLSSLTYSAKQLESKSGTLSEDEKKQQLRQIFSQLMEAQPTEVKTSVMAISQRYKAHLDGKAKEGEGLEVDEDLARLVCMLDNQYPGDVGVFCAFVLNVMEMKAGSAMFLMANEPHAYIEGDIVECMAASDNVVRAGLTPKARDVQVLVDMLTYSDEPKEAKLMKPKAFLPDVSSENFDTYRHCIPLDMAQDASLAKAHRLDPEQRAAIPTVLYDPPIEEFSVLMTRLAKSQGAELQRALEGPSVLIITSGSGSLTSIPSADTQAEERRFELSKPGQVYFVGAGTKIELQANDQDLVVYRAFVEVK